VTDSETIQKCLPYFANSFFISYQRLKRPTMKPSIAAARRNCQGGGGGEKFFI
tara:strand:+ start:13 stop:171 length:159 start_codon:yes stop_codon:yes gene_type:complete